MPVAQSRIATATEQTHTRFRMIAFMASDGKVCLRPGSGKQYSLQRAVAQLGSALEWGSRGRGFKSRRPDNMHVADHQPSIAAGSFIWATVAMMDCPNTAQKTFSIGHASSCEVRPRKNHRGVDLMLPLPKCRIIRHSLERAYTFLRVRIAVGTLLLDLATARPALWIALGSFWITKRRTRAASSFITCVAKYGCC